MIQQMLDSVSFHVKHELDLSFLKDYGHAFTVIDTTGSGCLCLGMDDGTHRRFLKIAGADTVEAEFSPEDSVRILRNAVQIYRDLEHPGLIHLETAYACRQLYVAVFDWADGECLYDHWNFASYAEKGKKSPSQRFHMLPVKHRLHAVQTIFSFLCHIAEKGYVAVDFYDGSLIYDFSSNRLTICDIDLFRRIPAYNDIGTDYWGTKRLKAPEEYIHGAEIAEDTNVFTLGALLLDIFGDPSPETVEARYRENRFISCPVERFCLSSDAYAVLRRAVTSARSQRFRTIRDFYTAWEAVTNK